MKLKITKQWNILFLIKTFLLLLFAVKCAHSLDPKSEGLYNTNDHVVILNFSNFQSNVYKSNSSWMVEFYSHWCGHCIRYAPIWKTFSKNVEELKSIVRIAAIDCANDINILICRQSKVTSYPALRFFSVNSNSRSLGSIVENEKDVASMQKTLLNKLETEKREGRGQTWPNIIPYRGQNLRNIWQTVSGSVNHIILIFENSESILGTSMILNFHKISDVHVGRVLTHNTGSLMLMFLQRNGSMMSMKIKNPTSDEIKKLITDKLQSLGVHIELTDAKEHNSESVVTMNSNKPSIDSKIHQSNHQFGDVLFQLDLEKALRYSLKHEIPMSMTIDGEKMEALKNYLNILASYFPMQSNGTTYLLSLQKAIRNQQFITGENFLKFSSAFENQLSSIYSGNDEWIGCQGSASIYRGFPCGLWNMFHMLSVNFANMNIYQEGQDPAKVLRAMHGYVKNFFGCAECSRHFLEMAEKENIFQVKNVDESILWLWRAHNQVNRRLAGDATEDPEHKKIQYPAINDCPSCRDGNGHWIESNVLSYLKKKYSSSGVNFYGSSLKSKKLYFHTSPKNTSPYLFFYD